jgi:hypothetical protein
VKKENSLASSSLKAVANDRKDSRATGLSCGSPAGGDTFVAKTLFFSSIVRQFCLPSSHSDRFATVWPCLPKTTSRLSVKPQSNEPLKPFDARGVQ